ncbi:hypothetical protein ACVWWN_000327 [Mycobacterium sp. URHB0021]
MKYLIALPPTSLIESFTNCVHAASLIIIAINFIGGQFDLAAVNSFRRHGTASCSTLELEITWRGRQLAATSDCRTRDVVTPFLPQTIRYSVLINTVGAGDCDDHDDPNQCADHTDRSPCVFTLPSSAVIRAYRRPLCPVAVGIGLLMCCPLLAVPVSVSSASTWIRIPSWRRMQRPCNRPFFPRIHEGSVRRRFPDRRRFIRSTVTAAEADAFLVITCG